MRPGTMTNSKVSQMRCSRWPKGLIKRKSPKSHRVTSPKLIRRSNTSIVSLIHMSLGESRNSQPERSWRSHLPPPSTLKGLRSPSPLTAVTTWTLCQSRGDILSKLAPSSRIVKLYRVLVDGGSSLNILFLVSFNQMGLSESLVHPSRAPFNGIVPSAATTPVSQITLPVTFGTRENFCTETIQFEVTNFEIAYNAFLGRPAHSKFMAIPH
jgi:hypothetical protein